MCLRVRRILLVMGGKIIRCAEARHRWRHSGIVCYVCWSGKVEEVVCFSWTQCSPESSKVFEGGVGGAKISGDILPPKKIQGGGCGGGRPWLFVVVEPVRLAEISWWLTKQRQD